MAATKTGGGNMVSLKVSVPRGVVAFLRDLSKFGGCPIDLREWIEGEIVQAAMAVMDNIDNLDFIDKHAMLERYGLEEEKPDDP